jgi:D-alanyl-D-alanine carboxypeptidase/D-alanyl-D-alanine-endopeptidase (penicillin-binding protein 4)
MAAELLALAAARRLTGRSLTPNEAAAVLTEWARRTVPGVSWNGFGMYNGSGLSKHTKIAPEQMVAVLRHAQTMNFGGQSYADLLRPYWLGKVEGEFDPEVPREKVEARVKTGTVNFARAVAGYMKTRKGTELIFAVFVSDYKVREVAQMLSSPYREPPVKPWMGRSREMMRSVVRRWAETM